MDIKQEKFKYLDQLAQVVLLDANGLLLDSCETFAPLKGIKDSLFEEDLLLMTLQETLTFSDDGEIVRFPKVETPFFGREGFYDYVIHVQGSGANRQYLWVIEDHSAQYDRLMEMQQEKNESVLANQALQAMQKKLEAEQARLRLHQEALAEADDFRNTFFTRMTYEWKYPIQAIKEVSRRLAAGEDLTASCQNMVRVMSRFLSTAMNEWKIDSPKKSRMKPIPFNLGETFQVLLDVFAYQDSRNRRLLKLQNPLVKYTIGDCQRFTQVTLYILGYFHETYKGQEPILAYTQPIQLGHTQGYNCRMQAPPNTLEETHPSLVQLRRILAQWVSEKACRIVRSPEADWLEVDFPLEQMIIPELMLAPTNGENGKESPQKKAAPLPFDFSYLRQITAGNKATMQDLLETVQESVPLDLEAMALAFEKQLLADVALLAHKMKPNFDTIGRKDLAKMVDELEELAREGHHEQAQQLFEQVREHTTATWKELETINIQQL